MGPRTDRRHQQGEESRQRILDATCQIAAERGYEGTSISLVSRRSGLPASSIYWHYANKDELLAAVIERSFNRWLSSLPGWEPPGPGVSLREHARAVWSQATTQLSEHADFLRLGLMLSLETRPNEPKARTRFLESRELFFGRLVEWFQRSMEWAGVEPDAALCRNLASLNQAVADGMFIETQITGDRARGLEVLQLAAELLAGAVEREVEAKKQIKAKGAARRRSR